MTTETLLPMDNNLIDNRDPESFGDRVDVSRW